MPEKVPRTVADELVANELVAAIAMGIGSKQLLGFWISSGDTEAGGNGS